ncbi:pyoverdine biosynthesis protein PvcA, partial [Streptomyces antimycoticus]
MPLTTAPDTRPTSSVSAAILDLLLPYHRTTHPLPTAAGAFTRQLRQIAGFVRAGEPVVFTLPGFPC